MKDVRLNYFRRILLVIVGMAVSAVGIFMMMQANIGVDPWNVLNQGIAHTFRISYGLSVAISGLLVLIISLLLRESFGVGTLMNIFVLGWFIDLIDETGIIMPQTEFLPGLIMLFAGMAILAIGTWIYMAAALGSGPRDSLMVALAKRTPLRIGVCRIITEVIVTVIGYFMGGNAGIGTLVSAFGIGLFIQLWFHIVRFRADEIHQENVFESIGNFFTKEEC